MHRKYLVCISLIVMLSGCFHGQISTLPIVEDTDNAAEIVIFREKRFAGAGVSSILVLDGQDFFAIRHASYVVIKVAPGRHFVGVKCPQTGIDSVLWPIVEVDVNCSPNSTKYVSFLIDKRCGFIKEVNKETAENFIKNYKKVKIHQ